MSKIKIIIKKYSQKLIKLLIRLLYPPKCIICGKIIDEDNSLCSVCWNKVKMIEKPYCSKCSSPLEIEIGKNDLCGSCLKSEPLYIKSRSAFIYNEEISKIVFNFKFYDKTYLKTFMAKNMIAKANDIIEKIDILIPVPLHKKRLIERKYNQSLLLCREITKRTNKKTIANFLFKIKHTKAQVKLNEKDRVSNLKKTFFVNEKYLKEIENYKNLNFAIIDDVVTTGTTINECTKALNNAGIKNVYSMTFAKTIKKF